VTGAADIVAVFPDPPLTDLVRTLDMGGYRWKAVGNADDIARNEPAGGYAAAVVACDNDPEGAWSICRILRKRDTTTTRVLLLVGGAQLSDLTLRDDLFDDFCIVPFHPVELEARLRHLLWHTDGPTKADLIEYSELALNVETYQATIGSRPLDLTYMEYELLRFLAQNPGKVFTREILLSRVWGYEYYGGARTVDVHVRRLRAKLGEEHQNLIETVRSVGYRFGQSRWRDKSEQSGILPG
jgi:two-component system, OmpR family, alkaline phosphatase synthesis response regulator PhoP